MISANEIRQGFIDFFRKQDHRFVASSPVVPGDDPTLLFINAGMNQFKDIFLGIEVPDHKRAVNSQKCIRVSGKHNDLEEVGKDTYHHTFFEMLGNWSFGDYFKAEAITWAWQLLTEEWGLDGNRLWATVFGGDTGDGLPADTEAEKLWPQNSGVPPERVLRFGRKDNFWEMGEIGPCGPCSEIHYDCGPEACDKKHVSNHVCRVNGDCARYFELWNLVFIQFNRDESGKLHELPAKHVDTGLGFERVVAVLQNKTSDYDTDLFSPIIEHLGDLTGKSYTGKLGSETDNAFRVVADHVRTLTFAITDGVVPSNDGRGYVLRRILRRATRFGLLLDMHEPFLHELAPTVVKNMAGAFPELSGRVQHVANVLKAEEQSFRRTLERGIDIFESDVAQLQKQKKTQFSGGDAFRLYDTYGFPLVLTQLMAEVRGLSVDINGFNKLMEEQRTRARASQKDIAYEADALSGQLPETDDSQKYCATRLTAKVLGYVRENNYVTDGAVGAHVEVGLVLDRTCAYSEAGGQVGDKGVITAAATVFAFKDTQRVGSAVLHFGSADKNEITVGDEVTITIDQTREDIRRNHTATHLLQDALQKVLGDHAHQEGSLVGADYLRFDFTHSKAATADELRQIERIVRDNITAGHGVTSQVMPIEQARTLGAMALFSEKYGDSVRVLAIGADGPEQLESALSREFCGGSHVDNTSEIGGFKIIREESVATGVRRITALTGRGLNDALYYNAEQIEQLCILLKTTPEQLFDRATKNSESSLKRGPART